MIRVIAVGKKHEGWVEDGISRYEKRLRKPYDVEWVLLPHSSLQSLQAREKESEAIHKRLDSDDYVILLDERGRSGTSADFASALQGPLSLGKRAVMIIGGAYGVDESVRTRADLVWSLSKQVFPHQMVRLILTEQIYRSQEIIAGNPYHHE